MEIIGKFIRITSNWGQNLQRTHLLIVNYAMDEKHQVFSHQVEVVNNLAKHFDQILVLTGQVGIYSIPENVKVISYDWVEGKRIISLFKFYKIFLNAILRNKFTCVFSHMTSVQSTLIAPITKIMRLKHFLWYAHTSNNFYLRASRLLLDGIITSTPGSCPISGKKIYPIGQAIDSKKFVKKDNFKGLISKLVHIGRFDPSKKIDVIVEIARKFKLINSKITLEIIGSPSSKKYEIFAKGMRNNFMEDTQNGWLKFTPSISRESIPNTIKTYDCFLHSFEGSLDKALVEATLSGIPVLTINSEYRKIFGSWDLLNPTSNPTLEEEGQLLFKLSDQIVINEINRRHGIAMAEHELAGWINRLVGILKGPSKV